MQFLIIGVDGHDKKAPKRRLAARKSHVALGEKLRVAGNLWYGAALIDRSGNKNGSMYLVDFPSRAKMQDWLNKEPYVVGGVWKEVKIRPCTVSEPWQFSRTKESFKPKKR